MTNRLFASALLLSTAGIACSSPNEPTTHGEAALTARADVGFDWPVPEHWGPETIPFPLPFAPELAYAGVEELRFMPHFFTPSAEGYFSYSFAWLLDGDLAVSGDQLGRDLTTYYSGLAHSADPDHFDASVHHAELAAVGEGHFHGVVNTADGFNQSVLLRLEADIEVTSCGDHRVVLFTLSPHAFGDATWTALLDQRQTFRCTR
jgi:hypothetical protein